MERLVLREQVSAHKQVIYHYEKNTCNNNIDKPEYKFEDVCAGVVAGVKCSNKPTALLKVKYINKTGSFCKQHTEMIIATRTG